MLLIIVLGALLGACGKKGDPEPPLLPIPQAATDLTVEQRGDELILRFAFPTTTAAGLPLPPLERIEVYELVRPAVLPPPPPAAAAPDAGGTSEPEAEAGPRGGVEAGEPEPAAEPGTGASEPGAGAEEPGTDAPEPGAAASEPGAGAEEPGTDAPEPGAATSQPDSGTEEPGTDGPEAAAAASEPGGGAEEPGTGAPEPGAAASEPDSGAQVSGAGAEGPASPPSAAPAVPAAPAPSDRYLPPPVDPREFAGAATVVRTLRAAELTGAVYGDRLVVTLPLPSPLPEPPQAHLFAVRTAAVGDYLSAFSNRAAIVPRPPPAPPTGLAATARAEGIEVAWEPGTEAAGLAGFHVYRRLAGDRAFGPPLRLTGPAQASFLDRDARYGQSYIYAVTAVADRRPLIESAIAASREVAYRDVFAPPAPTGLVALADAGAIRLVWDESRAPDLAGYRVSRRSGDAPWQPLSTEPIAGVEYIDRAVEPGTTYRYRIAAVDALGNESDPAETEALAR